MNRIGILAWSFAFAYSICGSAPIASAATIVGATSATASSNFGSNVIERTIDQSGLLTPYVSGVTDFDTYIASNPLHSIANSGEWFSSNFGDPNPQIDYDLGSALTIDRIALWNEESAGTDTIRVSTSLDGVIFTFLSDILPTNNTVASYGADVFSFTATLSQFFRFDIISGCPPPSNLGTIFCGLGEVAFSSVESTVVPLPAALPLFAGGLGLLSLLGWRRKRRVASA